jgi:hypothetical protein
VRFERAELVVAELDVQCRRRRYVSGLTRGDRVVARFVWADNTGDFSSSCGHDRTWPGLALKEVPDGYVDE